MDAEKLAKALEIMKERFGHDTLIALATAEKNRPAVRAVNSYYETDSFYVITHGKSNKMRQIQGNPYVSICGDWFTASGVGENLGHPLDRKNQEIMEKLREIFSAWYTNGHVDENDPNTCILRIRLTDGLLLSHGTRYQIDFTSILEAHNHNLNIHYTAPKYVCERLEQLYREMPGWNGEFGEGQLWYGGLDGKLINVSVEPSGLHFFAKMPQKEWDEWFSQFKNRASKVFGCEIGEPEDGFEFIEFIS